MALDRRVAVAALLEDRGDLLVVSGLGSPTYDVHAAGGCDANYYLWGAMGSAALIGLGLAQARPDRSILVITGDGEQLMGLGGLATIARACGFSEMGVVEDLPAVEALRADLHRRADGPRLYVVKVDAVNPP